MNRFSKKYFYYHLLVNLILPLILFLSSFEAMPTDAEENILFDRRIALIFLFIGIGAYLVSVAYSYLYYRTSGYEIREDGITCTRGVLFKKKSFLEYRKVHTINKRRGLIQQMFGLAYLLVDSGSTNTAFSAEVMIIETSEKVDALMEEIKARQNSSDPSVVAKPMPEEQENLYTFTSGKKGIYSLLNLLRVVILTGIVVIFVAVLIVVIGNAAKDFAASEGELAEILAGIFIAAGTSVAVVAVCSFVQPFLAYYRFRIFKKGEDIEIDYGLFVKNANTFQIRRIKAIRIHQGLLMRLFGYVSVHLEVIGYGAENGDNANKGTSDSPFLPLCKASEAEMHIRKILPEYVPLKRERKAKSYFALIAWPFLLFNLPLFLAGAVPFAVCLALNESVALAIFVAVFVGLSVLASAWILIDAALKYRYESFCVEGDKITIRHGGFFRTCLVLLRKNIIAVEDITTPMRKKRGIASYVIHFRGNAMRNRAVVEILDERDREALLNLLTD